MCRATVLPPFGAPLLPPFYLRQSMLRASSSPPPPMTWPLLKGPYNSLASSYLSTYLLLASSLPAAAAVGAAPRCWSYWRAGVKRIGILMTTNYYKCLLSGKFVLSFLILPYLYKDNLSMIRMQKSCQCLFSSKNWDTRRCYKHVIIIRFLTFTGILTMLAL